MLQHRMNAYWSIYVQVKMYTYCWFALFSTEMIRGMVLLECRRRVLLQREDATFICNDWQQSQFVRRSGGRRLDRRERPDLSQPQKNADDTKNENEREKSDEAANHSCPFRFPSIALEPVSPIGMSVMTYGIHVETTYSCFIGVVLDDEDVDLEAVLFAFSSSMWTAIEKRFQNAGSRTAPMVDIVQVNSIDWRFWESSYWLKLTVARSIL